MRRRWLPAELGFSSVIDHLFVSSPGAWTQFWFIKCLSWLFLWPASQIIDFISLEALIARRTTRNATTTPEVLKKYNTYRNLFRRRNFFRRSQKEDKNSTFYNWEWIWLCKTSDVSQQQMQQKIKLREKTWLDKTRSQQLYVLVAGGCWILPYHWMFKNKSIYTLCNWMSRKMKIYCFIATVHWFIEVIYCHWTRGSTNHFADTISCLN